MKIAVDFVKKFGEDQVYVNSIGNEFSSNYDIVNSSRYCPGGSTEIGMENKLHYFCSFSYNFFS